MIKVGTDCSGIEAPIQALDKLGIKYEHLFSSEIDKNARLSILANYNPKVLFEDMTKDRTLPKLDLYVCGFPCQPFSMAGYRKGSEDSRGNIFIHCVSTIIQTEPSVFILENVKGIMSVQGGEYFKFILNELSGLKNYAVKYVILNTKDYGIPQNRERLFVVGLMKSKMVRELQTPEKIVCEDIKTYVDKSCIIKNEYSNTNKKRYVQFKDSIFANLDVLFTKNINNRVNPNYCPTITAGGYVWCVAMQRKATIKELLSLQGFPINLKQVVSDNTFKKQIGNSMSVNVLFYLLKECFECVVK